MNISKVLESVPVVPLIQAEDPAIAVEISRALAAGGLTVAEVVFRTDRALECLRAVANDVPEMIAGAGTVLSVDQAKQAIDNGQSSSSRPGSTSMSSPPARKRAFRFIRAFIRPAKFNAPTTLDSTSLSSFPHPLPAA